MCRGETDHAQCFTQVLQIKAITYILQNAYHTLSMTFLATVTGFLRKGPLKIYNSIFTGNQAITELHYCPSIALANHRFTRLALARFVKPSLSYPPIR